MHDASLGKKANTDQLTLCIWDRTSSHVDLSGPERRSRCPPHGHCWRLGSLEPHSAAQHNQGSLTIHFQIPQLFLTLFTILPDQVTAELHTQLEHSNLINSYFYHPSFGLPAGSPPTPIPKSPCCRLSVGHYHEISNFPRPWPKMQFSPNFPGTEKGTSYCQSFPNLNRPYEP